MYLRLSVQNRASGLTERKQLSSSLLTHKIILSAPFAVSLVLPCQMD